MYPMFTAVLGKKLTINDLFVASLTFKELLYEKLSLILFGLGGITVIFRRICNIWKSFRSIFNTSRS
ncbi:hypothetical protein FPHOBKDP_00109 [Listeria phage LPJP1]|nr:hypothetical protein FPHOBKDP_00109 [Listeria phage LPJP1]